MKGLKKLVSLMLTILLAVSLVAVTSAEEEIVLDFPSWQATEAGFAEFWADLIARYEADHPGVKINLYQVAFSGYVDYLTTRIAGGNPPDILHIPTANFNTFYREGWFENLDERFAETDIGATWTPLQSAVQGTDGSNYGLLLMGYGEVLYYNEKILADAGIAVPTTMDEVLAAARALTKDTDGDGVVDQFGYCACTTTSPSTMDSLAPFVGPGSSWATGTEINVDSEKLQKGLDMYKTFYTEGLMPIGVTIEQARTYLLEGKAAMYIDGSYFWASCASAEPEVFANLRVTKVPTEVVVGKPSNSVHIAKNLPDDRKALVWDLYKLISSDEYQTKYAMYTTNPPPKSTAMTEELMAAIPTMELFAEQASLAVDQRPEAFIPVYTEYSNIVVDEVLAYCIDESMTSQECLKNIAEAVSNEIEF